MHALWRLFQRILVCLFLLVTAIVLSSEAQTNKLTLTWIDNSNDELGFHIERGLDPTGTFQLQDTVNSNATSYDDTNVTAGVTYCYRVQAFKANSVSPYTNVDCETVPTSSIPPPVAQFTASPTTGNPPLTVEFTDESTGDITEWSWDFGDTASNDNISIETSPSHTYPEPGTYTATLTVTGLGGSDEATKTITVTPVSTLSGVVAAYGFNGSGRTVTDASENGNHGERFGASRTQNGKFGKALAFDGLDDYVMVPADASLSITSALTIEAWIYLQKLTGYQIIADKTDSGQPTNYYLATLGDEVDFGFYNNGWRVHTTEGVNLKLRRWYHVAAVYNDAEDSVTIYVNGEQRLSATETRGLKTNNLPLLIGTSGFDGETFKGRIDELRIYDKALTHDQIKQDMNTPVQ